MKTNISKKAEGATIAPEQTEEVESHYIRVPEAARLSGLSESYLYDLAGKGAIKSAYITRRGCVRGVRTFHKASLLAFLEANSGGAAGVCQG